MRFVDLLKATVLLSAATATVLAVITVIQANAQDDTALIFFAAGWWALAVVIGAWLGRHTRPTAGVERSLREARTETSLPELGTGRLLLSRIWPLLLAGGVAAIGSIWIPQVAAVATGFGIIWARGWRRQDAAVTAIEQRDGVVFFVARSSAFGPVKLVRTPGLRREGGAEPRGAA
ncbi:MAG: hypothetical protein ACKOH7_06305 [Solirubrobacterales bacterium]